VSDLAGRDDDDIDPEAGKLRDYLRNPLNPSLSGANVNDEVLALRVAQLTQR
jgi:hypothetical protein